MNSCLKFVILVLLVKPLSGLGQQQPDSRLESLVASAQQAQAANDYVSAVNDYKQAVGIRANIPELWANLGLMQHQSGDVDGAIVSLLHAHRLNPLLYVPNLFLGIDSLHEGKAREAIVFLVQAERINKTDPQAHLALGRAYISVRRLSAAVQELRIATTLDSKLSSAWFALGIAHLDQVEESARQMSSESQNSPYAKALFAESLDKQARYHEAATIYRELLTSKQQPPCIRSELGISLLRQHDISGAAHEFTAELQANPQCGLAVLGQTHIAIENGANDRAIELIHGLWGRDHGFVQSNIIAAFDGLSPETQSTFLGYLSRNHGEITSDLGSTLSLALTGSAQPAVDSSGQRNSMTQPDSSRSSAQQLYASGRFERCANTFDLDRSAASVNQLTLLATCSFFAGKFDLTSSAAASLAALEPLSTTALYWSIEANERLALQSLARFRQLESDSARSHILLGDIYRQRERFDDAQEEYSRALVLAPNDLAALLGLASAYLGNNNLEKAMDTARLALVRDPGDPELNLVMAEAMVAHNDYANSTPYLEKSLQAKPQMLPHIHALIGKVYAETGRTQDAINQYRQSLPSDEDGSLHYQLARLYRQIGDSKDASDALDQMRIIKDQRSKRGMRVVDESDLSTLEGTPGAIPNM